MARISIGKRHRLGFDVPGWASSSSFVELQRTLGRPWFVARIDQVAHDRSIEQLLRNAIMIDVTTIVNGIASHTADDLVLSAAVSSHADYLVTGDAEIPAGAPIPERRNSNTSTVSIRPGVEQVG